MTAFEAVDSLNVSELKVIGHFRLNESTIPYGGHALWSVWCEILVDGVSPCAVSGDIGCLKSLVAAVQSDGVFSLFNCACGDLGCGGYYEGVEVHHPPGGKVVWRDLSQPDSATIHLDSEQSAAAISECVASVRSRLAELRGEPISFVCGDDADVFGLDWFQISLPAEVQLEFETGGLFQRRPDLFERWILHYRSGSPTRTRQVMNEAPEARAGKLSELIRKSLKEFTDLANS